MFIFLTYRVMRAEGASSTLTNNLVYIQITLFEFPVGHTIDNELPLILSTYYSKTGVNLYEKVDIILG